MSDADGLVTFLRARLDEDEAAARKSPPSLGVLTRWITTWGAEEERAETHYGRHDPARVLAEVEAKRWFLDWATEGAGDHHMQCLLALPYADHPDYREEWRP